VYEDSGDGYDYENGEFSTWDMEWDDEEAMLGIAEVRCDHAALMSPAQVREFVQPSLRQQCDKLIAWGRT
jgi:hypothetical protein